jgi:hypothetical protein
MLTPVEIRDHLVDVLRALLSRRLLDDYLSPFCVALS